MDDGRVFFGTGEGEKSSVPRHGPHVKKLLADLEIH